MTNIYSLVSIEKDCKDDQYIMAISYDKQVLENILATVKPQLDHLCDFAIKENTKLYKIIKSDNKHLIINKLKLEENYNLHGFNKITTNNCEQVLLDINGIDIDYLNTSNIFKNNISSSNIMFDTYYDESIMNASI